MRPTLITRPRLDFNVPVFQKMDGAFLLKMICPVDIALPIFSVTDFKRLLPPLSVTTRSYQRYSHTQKKTLKGGLFFRC